MASALIALGSNLGDRRGQLAGALADLERLPQTRLVARSEWHETLPIGGPEGQPPFLNGAARVATTLRPLELFRALLAVETALGRTRCLRWEARKIDLDLLLYDDVLLETPELTLPHPRMEARRFVLEPAVEVAPWMIHPTSGWTLASLLALLDRGAEVIAVAAADGVVGARLVAELARRLNLPALLEPPSTAVRSGGLSVIRWSPAWERTLTARPKLILGAPAPGSDAPQCRKILKLPAAGPVVWLDGAEEAASIAAAVAAVQSVWPALAVAKAD